LVDPSIAEGTANALEIELKEYCFWLGGGKKQIFQTNTNCMYEGQVSEMMLQFSHTFVSFTVSLESRDDTEEI
jgi:hypothetical protein